VNRAGGGGGSTYDGGTPGTASFGGGAGGNRTTNPTNGTANTGGGGGGQDNRIGGSTQFGGASGGSGIVILRYPATYTITVGAGLTAGVTNQTVGTNEKYTTITAGTGNVSWAA